MTCERCKAPNPVQEIDEDGDSILRCYTCGHRKILPRDSFYKSKIPKVEEIERIKREEQEKARPPAISSQDRAMQRYRKTDLFKNTNRHIQQRYRKSPQGKLTLALNRKRKSILNRLANKIQEEPAICPVHKKKILAPPNGLGGTGYCITCLKEKENW